MSAFTPLLRLKCLIVLTLILSPCYAVDIVKQGLPLYYWQQQKFVNFGDYLSLKLVERIVGSDVEVYKHKFFAEKKLLAVGSILYFAKQDDVIWGSGTNGKKPLKSDYTFTNLDIRAVRGPLTRKFLLETLKLDKCPEIYGDPALLVPYFFPEFKRSETPKYDYIVIPHYSEEHMFPKNGRFEVVYPTESLFTIFEKMMESQFVISSSLHGVIVAESFGIPARYLRVTENEPILKYDDYYIATNRPDYKIARSVEEALLLGGEPPFECDLEKLYDAFPFDYWPHVNFNKPDFSKGRLN